MKEPDEIWIVDDDRGILEVVQIILEESGYKALQASSKAELDKLLETGTPSLFLLDILISGSHGGDIARELKSNPRTKEIPVIMVSANMHTENIAREAGADGFLLKPFNIDDLESMVKKNIRRAQRGQSRKIASQPQ